MSDLTQLPGRIRKIIAWLLTNCQRVSAIPKGRVTFNFAGDSLRVELYETDQL